FSVRQSYTGQTALTLGNLTLAGGRNTILVVPTLTATVGNIQLNGGTLDLNGNDQAFGALLNSNTLAFASGTITNSNATQAGLTFANNNLTTSADLNPVRLPSSVPLTLRGATFTLTPGGSVDTTTSHDLVTILSGATTITPTVLGSAGAVNTVTIGNLVRAP